MSCFAVNLRNLLEKFFYSNCVIACFGGLNILKAENENSGATSGIRQVSLLLTSKTFSTLNLKEKSEICQNRIVKVLNNVNIDQTWVKSKVIDVLKLKPWSHVDIARIKETYLKHYQISMMEFFEKKWRIRKICDKLYQNYGFTSLASGKYFAFVF